MAEDFQELFDEGPQPEKPPPEYPVINWEGIEVRLLNVHHSLWGERLWEAGKIMFKIIRDNMYGVDVSGKTCIEFGAGVGLPSICCSLKGAKNVVSTDYPDQNLVDNLAYNVLKYKNTKVIGYQWGKDLEPVLKLNNGEKFDVAILSDLVFNHPCHLQLLQSLDGCLKRDGFALVTFTHHRPHLIKEDLHFFKLAKKKFGFNVEELGTVKHKPMFDNDLGPVEIRSTAHICRLTYANP